MSIRALLLPALGGAALLLLLARPRASAATPSPAQPAAGGPPKAPPAPGPGGSTAGRLLAAARAGLLAPITWIPVRVGDLEIAVASDALSADGVRWPASFNEALQIVRELGALLPTREMADAIFEQAERRVPARGQGTGAMKAEGTSRAFSALIDKDIAGRPGLAAGGWKHYLLDPRLPTSKGAVIYGFWHSGKPIQPVSGAHDAHYFDYSQLVQPVRRSARRVSTGEPVDLLDIIDQSTAGNLKPWLERLA